MSIQAPMPMSHHQSVAQFPSWVLPCSLRGWSLTGQPSPRSVQQNHVATGPAVRHPTMQVTTAALVVSVYPVFRSRSRL